MQSDKYQKIISFLLASDGLKDIERFTENSGMDRKESSADHAWRASLMAYLMSHELGVNLDKEKIIKMALIHNIFELFSRNIDYIAVKDGRVSAQEKINIEEGAASKVAEALSVFQNKEIGDLLVEYRRQETPEAKFVNAISKLETLSHLIRCGKSAMDRPDLITAYADDAVAEVPELMPFYDELRILLKKVILDV